MSHARIMVNTECEGADFLAHYKVDIKPFFPSINPMQAFGRNQIRAVWFEV
jgi:hypothetical protein